MFGGFPFGGGYFGEAPDQPTLIQVPAQSDVVVMMAISDTIVECGESVCVLMSGNPTVDISGDVAVLVPADDDEVLM